MKKNLFRSFLVFSLLSLVGLSAFAQKGSPSVSGRPSTKSSMSGATFRLLANYDYVMSDPKELNDYRNSLQWNNTTRSQGTFNNMSGFSIGAGYKVGDGFLGLEFNRASQELSNTPITPTTVSIQDTFEYEAAYLLYDYVLPIGMTQSLEFGGGVGYAIKYQYHNILTNGSSREDLYWQANPVVFKARAHYNYHFSDNVRLRVGATYEMASSAAMKADSNHPAVNINGASVLSGQNLRTIGTNPQDVKVDISGFRLSAGIVVAF